MANGSAATLRGEYLQLDMAAEAVLGSYSFFVHPNYRYVAPRRGPRRFALLGAHTQVELNIAAAASSSSSSSKWTVIDRQVESPRGYRLAEDIEIDMSGGSGSESKRLSFNSFRLVIEASYGDTSCSLSDLRLFGRYRRRPAGMGTGTGKPTLEFPRISLGGARDQYVKQWYPFNKDGSGGGANNDVNDIFPGYSVVITQEAPAPRTREQFEGYCPWRGWRSDALELMISVFRPAAYTCFWDLIDTTVNVNG